MYVVHCMYRFVMDTNNQRSMGCKPNSPRFEMLTNGVFEHV